MPLDCAIINENNNTILIWKKAQLIYRNDENHMILNDIGAIVCCIVYTFKILARSKIRYIR